MRVRGGAQASKLGARRGLRFTSGYLRHETHREATEVRQFSTQEDLCCSPVLFFGHLNLGFGIDFGFRISDLGFLSSRGSQATS